MKAMEAEEVEFFSLSPIYEHVVQGLRSGIPPPSYPAHLLRSEAGKKRLSYLTALLQNEGLPSSETTLFGARVLTLLDQYSSLEDLKVWSSTLVPQAEPSPGNNNNPVLARTLVVMRFETKHSFLKMLLDLDLGIEHSNSRFDL